MAEVRYIKTKMWIDGWFIKLSPEAKLLFVFLLSNSHTHICGYYEIPLLQIANYIGWTEKKVEGVMEELKGKVGYIDGWVCIKNYPKHQNVANNAKVQASIDRALEEVPVSVRNAFAMQTLPSILNSNSNSNSEAMDSLSIPSKSVDNPVDSGKLTDNPVHNVGKTYAVYGEFKNVRLSDEEKVRLINRYGRDEAKKLVEELSTYLSSSGKRYKSHYATLLTWARRKGLQIIPTTEPKMIAEMTEAGTVRMVPNPNYHG